MCLRLALQSRHVKLQFVSLLTIVESKDENTVVCEVINQFLIAVHVL